MAEALGVDIGGVIMDGVREDREWDADPPAIEGAISALTRLHKERFFGNSWLVSRCSAEAEPVLIKWLERHGFFNATKVDPQRVVFCREASQKAEICGKLDLTHFVDDRLSVLRPMIGLVPYLYCLRSRATELETAYRDPDGIRMVQRWTEITDALLEEQSRG